MTLDVFPQHPPHPYFGVSQGELAVDGRPISSIAAQVGRTPFYVYARRYLTERVRELRSILPRDVQLHYAMKANPMPAVVAHMVPLVDGIDVASAREMQVALDAGASPDDISFAGPGKSPEELERAVEAGITLNAESELELQRLAEIGSRRGVRPRIAIRVNPDFELKASGMRMGGGPKQFGIDAERVPELLRRLDDSKLEFRGFHIFSGSQNLRPESIIEAQQKSVDLAIQLARHAPRPVMTLNIGGGFGVPYFPGERPLDVTPIGANLGELLPVVHRYMPQARVVLELGRYLVGEAGIYVCRVLDRKISRGTVFLIVDGGLHQHLAATGNFGQVIRKNYPILVASRPCGQPRESASVVGPLCTPLDLLGDRVDLPKCEVGDLVAIMQSGAYGLSASPVRFLGHPEPTEILI